MAVGVTEIVNAGLARIGVDRITSFDNDASIVAQRCRDNYAIIRDAVLRSYPWNCAVRLASLPANAVAPVHGYAYAYNLPVDCLRLLHVSGELEDEVKYRVLGRQVQTDEPGPLPIIYIARVEDVAQYDALLVDALAARLAATLAYDRTGSQAVARDKFDVYLRTMVEARRVDAQEGLPEPFTADDWLKARI